MPYNKVSDLPAGVKDNLPSEAQQVYLEAFNNSFKGTCKEDEECAAKVAWSAVKNGWKKAEDGKWVKKSGVVAAFSFFINKAVFDKASGEYRWAATCSDTKKDFYNENMSIELFRDFIRRIKDGEGAPVEYRSSYWTGGNPYLSIAHYLDLGGWAVAGEATEVYVDGDYLKAKGTFRDTEVGRAAFKAICKDIATKSIEPIRISIAFLDYGHRHGDIAWERKALTDVCPLCSQGVGDKVYTKGMLIHLALTRIPANDRTDIDLEVRSMTSRKQDAESIVGSELAEQLEEESALIGKSKAAPAALVVKSEDETQELPVVEIAEPAPAEPAEPEISKSEGAEVIKNPDFPLGGAVSLKDAQGYLEAAQQTDALMDMWSLVETAIYNILQRPDVEDKKAAVKALMEECAGELKKKSTVESPLDVALETFKTAYSEILQSGETPDTALRGLQVPFEEFANSVKKSVMEALAKPESVVTPDTQILETLSQMREELASVHRELAAIKVGATLPPLTRRVESPPNLVGEVGVPARRSVRPTVNVPDGPAPKPNSLHSIVRRSVGLVE